MKVRFGLACAVAATSISLLAPAAGWGVQHTANFDDLAAGAGVSSYAGATFTSPSGTPVVFTPAHVATQTPPNALKAPVACDAGCATGAYKLQIAFDQPASFVALRAGLDSANTSEFPAYARLRAYRADDSQVFDSGDVKVADGTTTGPITPVLQVNAPSGQAEITRVVLTVAKETVSSDTGSPQPFNIDSVVWEDGQLPAQPPPPAPSVTITAPQNSLLWDRASDVKVSGTVTEPSYDRRDITSFCLEATDTVATTIPAGCTQVNRLVQPNPGDAHAYTFTDLDAPPLHEGINFIHAWVGDRYGQVAHASVVAIIASERSGLDTRVDGMEVTQSVQTDGLPVSSDGFTTPYHGVQLVAGARTIVRVFADAPGTGAVGQPVRGVQLTLTGFREPNDRGFLVPLPGGPLLPDNGPRDLRPGTNTRIVSAVRNDPDGGYVFTLPPSWTSGTGRIRLVAEVNPAGMRASVPEAAERRVDNTFTVTAIELHHRNPVTIAPIMVTWLQPGTSTTWTPGPVEEVFRELRNLVPLADDGLRILPYQAQVDTTNVAYGGLAQDDDHRGNYDNNGSFDRVAEVARRIDVGTPIGVNRGPGASDLARGLEAPVVYGPTFDDARLQVKDVAIVNQGRPRTSVPHEFMHTMHFFHAGYYCPTDFPYVEWDPDHRGYLDSTGLNRNAPGPRAGTYQVIPDDGHHYDVMSYCHDDEFNFWISAHNWDLFGGALPELPTTSSVSSRSLRAAAPVLSVLARVLPDGSAAFERVEPGRGTKVTASVQDASLQLVVKDAAGTVVSSTGVAGQIGHVDGDPGNLSTIVAAGVPAANAASIELQRDGQVLATAARSAHAPTVKVLAPARGARVGAGGKVTVRWRAADADGGDKPTAQVDLSLDGGRHWRALTGDVAGSSTKLPSALLPFSRRARVRVRVSDGWNVASATSAVFRSAGVRPQVTILAPAKGSALTAQGTLYASGQAVADDGTFLRGPRLTWKDGRHLIGHGRAVSVLGLAAGTHRLALLARDAHGRTGRATVSVKVSSEAPDLIGLKLPKKLGRRARVLKLTTGATVPCTLKAGGRRFALTRRARTLRIPIKPGRAQLKLTLSLVAGGKSAKLPIAIPRA